MYYNQFPGKFLRIDKGGLPIRDPESSAGKSEQDSGTRHEAQNHRREDGERELAGF